MTFWILWGFLRSWCLRRFRRLGELQRKFLPRELAAFLLKLLQGPWFGQAPEPLPPGRWCAARRVPAAWAGGSTRAALYRNCCVVRWVAVQQTCYSRSYPMLLLEYQIGQSSWSFTNHDNQRNRYHYRKDIPVQQRLASPEPFLWLSSHFLESLQAANVLRKSLWTWLPIRKLPIPLRRLPTHRIRQSAHSQFVYLPGWRILLVEAAIGTASMATTTYRAVVAAESGVIGRGGRGWNDAPLFAYSPPFTLQLPLSYNTGQAKQLAIRSPE